MILANILAIPNSQGKPVDCAIDSTGFKITIRGDYLGSKWKKKKDVANLIKWFLDLKHALEI